MSDYQTYVLGKDEFTVATPDLSDIAITTETDAVGTGYTIRAKCGLTLPLQRVLELMQAGMNFTVTLSDGKKYKLLLEPIE